MALGGNANDNDNKLKYELGFAYLASKINPNIIRGLASLNNEALCLAMASYIHELLGGVKYISTKKPRLAIAKELIKQGLKANRVCFLSGISKRSYFRIKKGLKDEPR